MFIASGNKFSDVVGKAILTAHYDVRLNIQKFLHSDSQRACQLSQTVHL